MSELTNPDSRPKLVIVSAPSGAGKTTLCARLLAEFPENLTLSISCTTRAPRPGEVDGRNYHFLTREDFQSRIEAGDFAEWAEVHGHFYGTSKSVIEKAWQEGKSVLLDIDVQGAASLRESFAGRCFSVFVRPPSLEVLEERLRARGTESEERIRTRLSNAREEMARETEFDVILVNDELDRAFVELRSYVAPVIGAGGAPR